ncbi:MAG TPA: NAD-dependent epimerase/dehydratase family protein [Verrucomicrobiae bacterium]|nr:NAD-dependent epimerase/dehydratase family protein [Verrucomicrobiae bacterium]
MRLLITGICGFVGSALARALLECREGLEVFGIDNLCRPGSETNVADLERRGVRVVRGDIRSPEHIAVLPDADWVIDCAANPSVVAGIEGTMGSRELFDHNLVGTLNVLEYCKSRRAGFILISTSRVYSIRPLASMAMLARGSAFEPRRDQEWPAGLSAAGISESFGTAPPVSLYGASKVASEIVALEYGECFGFPVWINRCGVLAGAGQFGRPDQGIVAYWINAWMRGWPLAYVGFGGTGLQVRDVLHPDDIVPVLVRQMAGADPAKPRICNFGGGLSGAVSLRQMSEWCEGRLGPRELAGKPETRPFDLPWVVMDCRLAERAWGWRPARTPVAIFEEVADHAAAHPEWLKVSGVAA